MGIHRLDRLERVLIRIDEARGIFQVVTDKKLGKTFPLIDKLLLGADGITKTRKTSTAISEKSGGILSVSKQKLPKRRLTPPYLLINSQPLHQAKRKQGAVPIPHAQHHRETLKNRLELNEWRGDQLLLDYLVHTHRTPPRKDQLSIRKFSHIKGVVSQPFRQIDCVLCSRGKYCKGLLMIFSCYDFRLN